MASKQGNKHPGQGDTVYIWREKKARGSELSPENGSTSRREISPNTSGLYDLLSRSRSQVTDGVDSRSGMVPGSERDYQCGSDGRRQAPRRTRHAPSPNAQSSKKGTWTPRQKLLAGAAGTAAIIGSGLYWWHTQDADGFSAARDTCYYTISSGAQTCLNTAQSGLAIAKSHISTGWDWLSDKVSGATASVQDTHLESVVSNPQIVMIDHEALPEVATEVPDAISTLAILDPIPMKS